jgi:acetyl esterase/lipase
MHATRLRGGASCHQTVDVAITTAAAQALLLALALVALVPVFRPPWSGFSFTVGFPVAELAGQLLVASCALTVALAALGWPSGVLGVIDGVLAVGTASAYGAMLVASLRARSVVARALAPLGVEPSRTGRSGDAWLCWWRTCLAAPIVRGAVTVHRDVAYADDGDPAHLVDVYTPRGGTTGAPVLVFVHGGAWVFGSKRTQGLPMLHELAARGWVCVTCDYRLSPRATWPDHVVDVKRAIAWTRDNAQSFGGDPGRFLAVAGSSAGGHLAALSALTGNEAAWQPGFEDADTRVDACISLYGVLEMTGDPDLSGRLGRATVVLLERAVMKSSLESQRAVYEAASPLHRLREDTPPFLVLHGTKDSLVPVAVPRAFVAAFRAVATAPVCYAELPWAQHAFDLLCSPRATATVRGVAAFLDALVAIKPQDPVGDPAAPPAPR